MAETVYFYPKAERIGTIYPDIRWLDADEYEIFDRHLKLCGQKTECTAEKWRAWNENAMYCGLFADGEMIARACVERYSPERWEVGDVRVAREYRNRGCAGEVCSFVLDYILSAGRTATIRTEDDNLPMRRVIARLGFIKLSEGAAQ